MYFFPHRGSWRIFFIAASVNFELNFIHSTNCPPLHAHTHTYTHILTYIHMYTHICTPVHVCVCILCLCVHTCMCGGVFMPYEPNLHGKCRYFRDATLNICKCPSKDLSIEDTGWQKQLFFLPGGIGILSLYKMSAVLCYVCVNDNVCV